MNKAQTYVRWAWILFGIAAIGLLIYLVNKFVVSKLLTP